jgi:hypothetical protein
VKLYRTIFLIFDLSNENVQVTASVLAQLPRELVTIDHLIIALLAQRHVHLVMLFNHLEVFRLVVQPTLLTVPHPGGVLILQLVTLNV